MPAASEGSVEPSTGNFAATAANAGCEPKRAFSAAARSLRIWGSVGDMRAISSRTRIRASSSASSWYSARNRSSRTAAAPPPFFLTAAATPKKSGRSSASSSMRLVQTPSSASNFFESMSSWNSGGGDMADMGR